MDIIFNMKKIKFAKIDELINANKIDISSGRVNMFIDLEPILNRLATRRIDDYLRVKNDSKVFQLISNIINLAAHYRLYFSSRKIESTIFLYLQHPFNNEFKNASYNKDYRRVYTFKYVDNINNFIICDNLTASIPLIRIILEYINNVFFIESHNIENSAIPYILSHDDTATNFILTDTMYNMQYCGYGYNIMYPRQDDSRIITRDNVIETFSKIYKVNMNGLSYKQIPFILSIVGNSARNIYGIKGIGLKRAVALIQNAINKNAISRETDNINLLTAIVKDSYVDTIQRNYCCTDIKSQYDDCTKKDIYQITSQLINKFDNDALKKLNDQYFEEYPLMLDAITSLPRKPRQDITF